MEICIAATCTYSSMPISLLTALDCLDANQGHDLLQVGFLLGTLTVIYPLESA
jgi:hypothetical protein